MSHPKPMLESSKDRRKKYAKIADRLMLGDPQSDPQTPVSPLARPFRIDPGIKVASIKAICGSTFPTE